MDRTILSGFLAVASSKVISVLMGVITTPILFRMLGPQRVGIFSTVLSVQALFMILVSSGVTDGVRKFVAEDRPLEGWKAEVVGFYFRLAFVLALGGAAVMYLATATGVVAAVFGERYTPYFYLLVIGVFAAQFWGYARRTLMGFGLERYSEPLKLFNYGLYVGLALPLVALGYGAMGALIGRFAGAMAAAAIGLAIIKRRQSLQRVVGTAPSWLPRREMLTFNSLTIVLMFLMMSLYHVDIVMLQVFAGGTKVGHYKGALKLAEFLWMVPLTIQTVFVHSTSELWSNDRYDRINELSARTTRYALLLTTVMGLGLASLADVAVPLYLGQAYMPAVTPLLLLIPGAIGFALARPVLAIEQGHGDLRYPIVSTAAAAGINLVLNLLLIPRFGMHGAAVATSVGYASMFAFHLWSARRLGFDPLDDIRAGRVALAVVLSAGPIFYLARQLVSEVVVVPVLGVHFSLSLIVVPPAGLAVFLTAAFLTGALHVSETVEILTSCPEPVGSFGRTLRRRFVDGTTS